MLMYTPHPDELQLKFGAPAPLVEATGNDYSLDFDDLLAMRRMIAQLADDIEDFSPDFVPFFATGGIPYVFPLMHVLEQRKRRDLIDGNHFHMFPGLSWSGKEVDQNGGEFFAAEFAKLISCFDHSGSPLRLWTVDATFTGNAVRCAMNSIYDSFARVSVPPAATVHIVGVIDCERAKKEPKDDLLRLVTPFGDRYVECPADFEPQAELRDGEPVQFIRKDGKDLFELSVTFRCAPTIPTEDRAELIGAHANHSVLGMDAESVRARLTVKFSNGYETAGTGGGGVARSILNWLSKTEDRPPWAKFIEISKQPALNDEELESLAEWQAETGGGLSIFEAMESADGEIITAYMGKKQLLAGVEIYNLKELVYRQFGLNGVEPTGVLNNLLRKVISSALAEPSSHNDALALLRACKIQDAVDEPDLSTGEALEWWKNRIPRD